MVHPAPSSYVGEGPADRDQDPGRSFVVRASMCVHRWPGGVPRCLCVSHPVSLHACIPHFELIVSCLVDRGWVERARIEGNLDVDPIRTVHREVERTQKRELVRKSSRALLSKAFACFRSTSRLGRGGEAHVQVLEMARPSSLRVSERGGTRHGCRLFPRPSTFAPARGVARVGSFGFVADQEDVRIRPGTSADRRWVWERVFHEKMNPCTPLFMDGFLLAVDAKDERVGCLKVVRGKGYVELSSLIVVPERRQQGVAKKLVRAAQAQLSSDHAVYLTTIPSASGFWNRLGFHTVPWQDAPLPLVVEAGLGNVVSRLAVGQPCLLLAYRKDGPGDG